MYPSSSSTDVDAKGALLEFSRVGKVLSKHEERLLPQIIEVVKRQMKRKAAQLIEAAGEDAIFYFYSCDATPLKCSFSTVQLAGDKRIFRKGRELTEFLLQRAFLKTKLASGEERLTFLYGSILPLTEGKKAFNFFNVMLYFLLLWKAGHDGIFIYHVVSDRAVFSSLDRFVRQRLEGYYTQGLGPALGEERFHLQLMDWSLGTACCCHDVHNSLKWALAPYGKEQKKASCKRDICRLCHAPPHSRCKTTWGKKITWKSVHSDLFLLLLKDCYWYT